MNLSGHFFIIGAQKAGTTSLFRYLATHPEIFGALKKETKFFCKPQPSAKRVQPYESFFEGRQGERWAFEASPHYTQYPKYTGVPERMHAACPDARLVYVIRHPVERIYSHYIFRLASPAGRESKSFEDAIRDNPVYLATSSYYLQLTQYLPYFPSERIHVLLSEDLAREPRTTLRGVFEFLDVDPDFEPPNLKTVYNEGKDRTTMVTPVFHRLKKSRVYDYLPVPLRRWMRRRVRVPAPTRADIFSPESYNRIHAKLTGDVARLEEYLGRKLPWDFPTSKYS
jgi:hypothetical protein